MSFDYFDVFDPFDGDYDGDILDLEESELGALGWSDDVVTDDLTYALRVSLSDAYADASDEEIDAAMMRMVDEMSPAESVNFANALGQISRAASGALADPTVAALGQTSLPLAGGALGTMVGGPTGMALGSQLGRAAASALPPRGQAPAPTTRASTTPSTGGPTQTPVAGGSSAAAQALVLAQQPQILQSLLATALGEHGRGQVGGVPVAQLLGMLSQVVGQAAADADELMYGQERLDPESLDVPRDVIDRSMYAKLLDSTNLELADPFNFEGSA